MTRTLFISDLHLDPAVPAGIERFRQFAAEMAPGADALYILGDLFEMWIGDDAEDAASEAVIATLSGLAEAGTRCFLMPGNRDFLMGEALADACGAVLLDDPERIELAGRPCVLAHGDALCTADTAYMELRGTLRSPEVIADLLARPLAERAAIGADARRRSREAGENKPEHIMDVTPTEVDALLDARDADLLIHGHTHRAAVHHWRCRGRERTRVVLGDWGEMTRYAEVLDREVSLRTWP